MKYELLLEQNAFSNLHGQLSIAWGSTEDDVLGIRDQAIAIICGWGMDVDWSEEDVRDGGGK